MKIIKFGGSTFKSEIDIDNTIDFIVNNYAKHDDLTIIISAFDKLTTILKHTVANIISNPTTIIYEFNEIKVFLSKFINLDENPYLNNRLNELKELFNAIAILEECSVKTLDAIISIGDLISSEIFYLKMLISPQKCNFINAREVFISDCHYGNAKIDFDETLERIKNKFVAKINITAGFIGSTKEGEPTTLGMENSNLSAILCSIALGTKDCEYITDTSGIFEIDPKILSSNNIKNINYSDALLLAKYGLKQFTSEQIYLAKKYNIELKYLSIKHENQVTTITNEESTYHYIYIQNQNIYIILSKDINLFLGKIDKLDKDKIKEIKIDFEDSKVKIILNDNSNSFLADLYLKLNN